MKQEKRNASFNSSIHQPFLMASVYTLHHTLYKHKNRSLTNTLSVTSIYSVVAMQEDV